MKIKLQFGIFVILLAFLGTYLEQTNVPNQQIVIQFSDKAIALEDANNTIEVVKNKLEKIGVKHIQIVKNNQGQLKITYYSDSGVEDIQNILSKENGFKLTYNSSKNNSTDFPNNQTQKDYELNISEIKTSSHINWDFESTQVVEFNQKSEHSHNLKVNTSGRQIHAKQSNAIATLALQINNSIAITIDHLTYKIPEVRAGPTA